MKRLNQKCLGLFALLACCHGWFAANVSAQGTAPVIITLQAEVVVDDSLVTLEQIAKLSGGSEATLKRLGMIDLAEFKLGATSMTVLGDQVRFRLLLAGFEETQFRLAGAKRTFILESDEPVTQRKILVAAHQVLREQYPGQGAEVSLTADRGIHVPRLELRKGERVRFDAKVSGQPPRTGQAKVEVSLLVGGKIRDVVPVSFEITKQDLMPVSARKDKNGVHPALFTAQAAEAGDFLIKTRDNVKIMAHVGSARIEALGEAQQDGRLGDMIRVRNVESNRIVVGRVEAGGLIVVDY